jgi:peptide deformylase
MSGTQDASVSPTSVELPTGGTVRPVVRWGTDVMHRRARPVTSYDEELRGLVADMVATMYAAQGVGLAACQIGVDLAVFAFDCPDEAGTNHRGVVCNPVVELREGRERRLDDGEEGCLSYPGAFVDCARPEGTVFGDRISDRARKKLRKAMEAAAEDYPLDWPLGWPVGEDVGAPGRGRGDGGTTGPDTGGDDTVR